MKIRNIIISIIALVVIGFLVFRFTQSSSVNVKKVSVSKGDVIKSVSTSGFVKSELETEIGFPISGKVTHVYFKEGDQVKAGDLIAQIYSEDLYFSAESARKDKDATQRTRDIYVQNYQNNPDRVGGQKEYDLNIRKLTDQLRSADNVYKSSLANLQKTYLYAPINGTLTMMDFEVGNIVSLSNQIRISNLGQLVFQADLDQEDYKDIEENQKVQIELDSYPNERFEGSVLNKPLFVDEESVTKTFKVKIGISPALDNNSEPTCDAQGNCLSSSTDSTSEKIVKGMTGDANIITATAKDVTYLPFDAIYYDSEGKSYVWTIDQNGKTIKSYIETGLEGDTLTEIKNTQVKEVVIPLEGSKEIKEGQVASFNE